MTSCWTISKHVPCQATFCTHFNQVVPHMLRSKSHPLSNLIFMNIHLPFSSVMKSLTNAFNNPKNKIKLVHTFLLHNNWQYNYNIRPPTSLKMYQHQYNNNNKNNTTTYKEKQHVKNSSTKAKTFKQHKTSSTSCMFQGD